MPTLDLVLTVVNGVDDTTAEDFQRAQKIVRGVIQNLRFGFGPAFGGRFHADTMPPARLLFNGQFPPAQPTSSRTI